MTSERNRLWRLYPFKLKYIFKNEKNTQMVWIVLWILHDESGNETQMTLKYLSNTFLDVNFVTYKSYMLSFFLVRDYKLVPNKTVIYIMSAQKTLSFSSK